MKVRELIEQLSQLDPGRIVVMSKDGEGNGFSPLADIGVSAYQADSTWSGGVGLEKLTPELRKRGYTEQDVLTDGEPAIVLWPTN